MNKKIVIVSIFLVIILVLVTYTSAVGIQSKKSSNLKNCSSPLFTYRINNAINSNTPELKSNYIGKEEIVLNVFPMKLFIDKKHKLISKDVACNGEYNSSGCITSDPCGPTDNGPFCDINLFYDEQSFPLLQ